MTFQPTESGPPPPVSRLRVAQVVDSLASGGTERFAVNLANTLAANGHESHLCSTREEGLLAEAVKPGVSRLRLNRSRVFDPIAFIEFARYLNRHRIEVLHAHSSAVFISMICSVLSSRPRIVWHLHQGKLADRSNAPLPLRLVSRRVAAVIAVNRPLAQWAIESLHMPPRRVNYIANYVRPPVLGSGNAPFPGTPGFRIVCVGNLRPEKDTLSLLAAMTGVLREVPQAHLLIVGGSGDPAYSAQVKEEITTRRLERAVTLLGPRDDVPEILQSCDIAVMSSAAEGFPLAMLEYGAAGLPTVATRVGACPEILDNGQAGLVVPPSSPNELASALLALLKSSDLRQRLGTAFKSRVEREYGEQKIVSEITDVYRLALSI